MDIKLSAFVIAAIAFTNISCTSTNGLYKALTKNKVSLKYMLDSDVEHEDKNYTVAIKKPVITDPSFTKTGELKKLSGYVVPVIFYTEWKSIHDYRIGANVIAEDVASFVQEALILESDRSGIYMADTISLHDELTLEIEIDSVSAKGPYVDQGEILFLLFAYSYSVSEMAGPGMAYSRFHYTLKKQNAVIFDDYVSNRYTIKPLVTLPGSPKNLRTAYTINLVESLSQTFKANIEVIIEDINIYLEQEMAKAKN